MISIKDFCEKHNACEDGKKWALENCTDMQDAFSKAKSGWSIWIATRKGVLTDKELLNFAVFCACQNWKLLKDKRSKKAICVAHRYALGRANKKELYAAYSAASSAASSFAAAAFAAAAFDAADFDAAAFDAADFDAAAARAAAMDAQKEWLIKNTKNNFGDKESIK
jgi:hypothetical protein